MRLSVSFSSPFLIDIVSLLVVLLLVLVEQLARDCFQLLKCLLVLPCELVESIQTQRASLLDHPRAFGDDNACHPCCIHPRR
jgi:hypothetical protein